MGYDPNRIDASLADVVGSTPDHDDHLFDHDDWWLYDSHLDWDYGDDLDDPPPYYHDYDPDEDDAPIPLDDLGHDPYEHLPFIGKISPAACLGTRVQRPGCRCCGGFMGVRRAWRRIPKFNVKPKRKEHRS